MLVLLPGISKVRIDELAFTPDGAGIVAPAASQGVMLWNKLVGKAKSAVIKPPIVCKRIAFGTKANLLYTGNDQLCVYDLAEETETLLDIPKWAGLHFGVSPDGQHLVVAEMPQDHPGMRLTIWATDALDEPVRTMESPARVYSSPLFLPGGDRFVLIEGQILPSRQWEYRFVVRSLKTGLNVDQSDPLSDCPDQVVIAPDGSVVVCRIRETIWVYSLSQKWKPIGSVSNDSKKQFTGLAFHPSGRFLAATNNDETVKLFDTGSWTLTTTFTWDIGRTRSIAFSPDGMLAAAGSDKGKVVVWDVDV